MVVELTPQLQRNRGSLVVVAALFAVGSMCILIAVLSFLLWRDLQKDETDRLGPFSSPSILNRVPGVVGPAARQGEVVSYRGERCAVSTTVVESTIFYQAIGGKSVPGEKFTINLIEGCSSPPQQTAMPDAVTVGNWTLSGIIRDKKSGEVRYWTSEPFTVVP